MSPAVALVLSGVCFAISHSAVKTLQDMPVTEIMMGRATISVLLSFAWLRARGVHLWGRNKKMLVLRGAFGTFSLFLYFYTLVHMPLASAVTLNYLTPLFTVLISWFVNAERPKWHVWPLLATSFAGVLLVRGFDARISTLELGAGIGAAVFAAAAFSLVRKLRSEDHPMVVVMYFQLVTMPMVLPFAVTEGWVVPHGLEWLSLALIGVFTLIAQYFLTRAYQGAPAASISNLNYLTVIYAIAIGWFGFRETLEPLAIAGIAIIILSAAVSVRLEARARKR